jgi:hypothetical protein
VKGTPCETLIDVIPPKLNFRVALFFLFLLHSSTSFACKQVHASAGQRYRTSTGLCPQAYQVMSIGRTTSASQQSGGLC